MRQGLAILALLLAGCAAGEADAPRAADQGDRLARALAGRSPGPTVDCVAHRDLGSSRAAGDAILFQGRGGTLYLNRPAGGCSWLRDGNAIVTRTSGSQLCRGDIVTILDPVSRVEYGGCALGAFTPYRRRR
jgi:hypothetical protein